MSRPPDCLRFGSPAHRWSAPFCPAQWNMLLLPAGPMEPPVYLGTIQWFPGPEKWLPGWKFHSRLAFAASILALIALLLAIKNPFQ